MAGGLLGSSIMIYMSETAMPQFRGALLASFSLFFAVGQLFLAVGLKILEDTAPLEFRNIFYSEFVLFGLWLIPMVYLPESPGSYILYYSDDKESDKRIQYGTPYMTARTTPRKLSAVLSGMWKATMSTTSTT